MEREIRRGMEKEIRLEKKQEIRRSVLLERLAHIRVGNFKGSKTSMDLSLMSCSRFLQNHKPKIQGAEQFTR